MWLLLKFSMLAVLHCSRRRHSIILMSTGDGRADNIIISITFLSGDRDWRPRLLTFSHEGFATIVQKLECRRLVVCHPQKEDIHGRCYFFKGFRWPRTSRMTGS